MTTLYAIINATNIENIPVSDVLHAIVIDINKLSDNMENCSQ